MFAKSKDTFGSFSRHTSAKEKVNYDKTLTLNLVSMMRKEQS